MKKIFTGFILSLLIISIAFLSSCKSCSSEKQEKKSEQDQVKKIESQIESHVSPLPTSAQVIQMLTEFEVGYSIGLTNPVENMKKYFESSKRALNLGVFGADLSYATLYNQAQEIMNYLEGIRSLSNELNLGKIYDENLYPKIRDNFDNRDTLVNILQTTFNETYAFLSDNGEQPLALLVVGGAWVEGIYLTTQVSDAAYQVAGISRVLLDQKKSFETYLEITQPYMSEPIVGDFVKSLDQVKKVYEGIGTSLTEENIKDITKAIVEVRSKIVQ
jgi:hypothetical protein